MRSLMPIIIRLGQVLLITLATLSLIGTAYWLHLERQWTEPQNLSPEDAFNHGTLGLEFAPVKYLLVMSKVSALTMTKGDGRDWQTSFGFLPSPGSVPGDTKPACVSNAADHLPIGITVSHLLPGNAGGSPVLFAGLACAACHSNRIHRPDGSFGPVIYGVGNTRLDLIAWTDAFRNALLDPGLDAASILKTYRDQGCDDDDAWSRWPLKYLETFIISSWLDSARAQMTSDDSKYDLPYAGTELDDAANMPAGPLRTRPFRSIVRNALDLPGQGNLALSKIPVVFEQNQSLKPRSQFDGSISDPVIRSMVAAFASGSTVEALSQPITVENIQQAAAYTLHLGDNYRAYAYETQFTDPSYRIDQDRAQRGFQVYQQKCMSCHGSRPLGGVAWNLEGAPFVNQTSLVRPSEGTAIGTDAARVEFRYADLLPAAIYLRFPGSPVGAAGATSSLEAQRTLVKTLADEAGVKGLGAEASFWAGAAVKLEMSRRLYPAGHPLSFRPETLVYKPGYLNSPIPFSYLRAPFLHNGSVPTLAALINLTPRPTAFCRGDNSYDPIYVGLAVSAVEKPEQCGGATPYFFDTRLAGNGNKGHDFPWTWDNPERDEAQLRDLLEYLKTL